MHNLEAGYNIRRTHQVPLISTINRNKRLQFARAHQNWTVEDWKNVAWSDESDEIQMVSINCKMLSYQYGPTFLKNAFSTLLNQCHIELRQFWRWNGGQTQYWCSYCNSPLGECIYGTVQKFGISAFFCF